MVTAKLRHWVGRRSGLVGRFLQPYYVLRPGYLAHRLTNARQLQRTQTVRLPWGLDIVADPTEAVGRLIVRNGLLDLSVSEVLSRLIKPGETAVDVGANIGHMTSIMALRAGTDGRVIAFEPHPKIYSELAANVARWQTANGVGPIEIHEMALSDTHGLGTLVISEHFAQNHGSAFVEASAQTTQPGSTGEKVLLERLDQVVEGPIAVMKIDVEGHELQVLRGAAQLLERNLVRDIIFEEHGCYPTPVTELLEASGFTVFGLDRSFLRPRLVRPAASFKYRNEAPNCVASIDPGRVQALLAPIGWSALGLRTIPMPFRSRTSN